MRRVFGIILSPLHYIVFGLMLALFEPAQRLAYKFGGYKAHKKVVDTLNCCLTATYYLLFNRVTFKKIDLPKNMSFIFVANHQSRYDISPLIWKLAPYHAKFISKIELADGIPSISYNLRVGGGANIDRKDPRQSITQLMGLGIRMQEKGWSTIIFPEGTRSKTGVVKTFQSAGIATILKKCPEALIVPIAVENSWKMVRYGTFPLSTFEHLKFTMLAPIEPQKGLADEAVKQAETEIRKFIGQA